MTQLHNETPNNDLAMQSMAHNSNESSHDACHAALDKMLAATTRQGFADARRELDARLKLLLLSKQAEWARPPGRPDETHYYIDAAELIEVYPVHNYSAQRAAHNWQDNVRWKFEPEAPIEAIGFAAVCDLIAQIAAERGTPIRAKWLRDAMKWRRPTIKRQGYVEATITIEPGARGGEWPATPHSDNPQTYYVLILGLSAAT